MKLMIAVAFAAVLAYTSAQTSTECKNCETCANPGPLCEECPKGNVLSASRTSCLPCPTGCDECTADSKDVTKCTKCSKTYYLTNLGQCNPCGTACQKCHEDATKQVVCDECQADGYAQDMSQKTQPCVACPTNCKKCSVQTDGTTQCSECFSYKGLKIRGYYLKASDKSCKSCPSFCEKCNDDGNGVGICSSCFENYVSVADGTQTAVADGTKCLSCPSTCGSCSGEMQSSTVAKCTDCKPDQGNYLDSAACTSCGTGCKNCDSTGQCTECKEEFRLDSGSCTACPAFCKTCSQDANSVDTCSVCKDNYGVKEGKSVTCDSCGVSNCQTCSRSSSTGAMTCSTCKTGYQLKDGACSSCGTGCSACTYNTTATAFECDTCSSGFTNNPSVKSDKTCTACPTGCATCQYQAADPTKVDCLTCTDTTNDYVLTGANPKTCATLITGCKDGDTTTSGQCDTCKPAYYKASVTNCASCLANCLDCNDTASSSGCDTGGCAEGYIENSNQCHQCAVSDCKVCTFANKDTKCTTCNDKYILFAGSGSNADQCIKCPSNCNTCSQSSGTASCTTCATWTSASPKGYVLEAGACKACPSKCKQCTWDSATSSTKCNTDQCDTGYTDTPEGQCEACPSNCDVCDYDTDLSAVVCKTKTDCKDGYGRKTDKLCYACPNQCKVCNIDTTLADDVLYCDTCNDGYEENKDVCAKCPSNCLMCTDTSGTMTCKTCKAGYALDSSSACVKCPTNCNTCSAGAKLTCSDCKTGYALSADKTSCVDCATAATENCALCTSVDPSNNLANCTKCSSSYALQDEKIGGKCVDASSLSCGSGKIFDNEPECSKCKDGYTLDDFECIVMCYSCGDPDAGVYVDKASCTIPGPNANATETDAKLKKCKSGICFASFKGGQVAAGCLPKTDSQGTCTGDRSMGETCQSTANGEVCSRCCEGTDKCNNFVSQMDGQPDSASMVAFNTILIVAAALYAMFN